MNVSFIYPRFQFTSTQTPQSAGGKWTHEMKFHWSSGFVLGDVSYHRFYGLIKNFFVNVEVILLLYSNIELFIKFISNVLSSSLCFDCRMVRCMVKSSCSEVETTLILPTNLMKMNKSNSN